MNVDVADALKAIAPAKVNLSLSITGKRPDGYHLLESLVVFTEFGDEVEVTPAATLSLHIEGPFAGDCGAAEDNLILRAARLLAEVHHISAGAHIKLIKHIPVGAGLGGGSSDAATVTRLLCSLWAVAWEAPRMAELLLPLGADLPACIHAVPLWMRGIGDDIECLDAPLPNLGTILLVNPLAKLDTKAVYHAFTPAAGFSSRYDGAGLREYIQRAGNDLTEAAIALCPEVAEVLATLESQQNIQVARMSGSGATCFGLFTQASSAQNALLSIKAQHPTWWLKVTAFQ